MQTNKPLLTTLFWLLLGLILPISSCSAQPHDYDGLRLIEAPMFTLWDTIYNDPGVDFVYADATHGAMERNVWYEYYLRGANLTHIPFGSVHRLRAEERLKDQMENLRGTARRPVQDLTPMVSIEDLQDEWTDAQIRDSLLLFMQMCERYYGRSPIICCREEQAALFTDTMRLYHLCLTECDSLPLDTTVSLWQDKQGHLHRRARMADLMLRYPREAYFQGNDTLPDGIDVSKYQRTIDWNKLRPYHLQYCFIRATLGDGYEDPFYRQNVEGAKRIGVPVSAYHYFNTKKSARSQFRWFAQHVKREDLDLPPMLDVEEAKNWQGERLRDSINVWVALCEEHYGCRPIIYTYQNFYNTHLSPYYQEPLLFLAKYSTSAPTMYLPGHGQIWQYSCEGTLEGIPAKVDLSKLHEGVNIQDYLIHP